MVRASDLPAGCSNAKVRTVFAGFLAGINKREPVRVRRYIAPRPELNWFGLAKPGGGYVRLETPRRIVAYFLARSRAGVRLSAKRVRVSPVGAPGVRSGPYARPDHGPAADDPVAAVEFELDADVSGRADGEEDRSARIGKAGINCATKRFYIWNGG